MRTPARSPLLIFLLPIVVSLAVCLGVLGAMLPVGVQAQEAPRGQGRRSRPQLRSSRRLFSVHRSSWSAMQWTP